MLPAGATVHITALGPDNQLSPETVARIHQGSLSVPLAAVGNGPAHPDVRPTATSGSLNLTAPREQTLRRWRRANKPSRRPADPEQHSVAGYIRVEQEMTMIDEFSWDVSGISIDRVAARNEVCRAGLLATAWEAA